MKNLTTCLVIIVTVLSSCENHKKETAKEKAEEEQQHLNFIASEFNALIFPDTVLFPTTLYFQNILSKNKKFLLNDFTLNDIAQTDTAYNLFIEYGLYSTLYIELSCSEDLFKKFSLEYPDCSTDLLIYEKDLILIVFINSAERVRFSLESERSSSEEGYTECNVELNTSDSFILKGELIDLYINKSNSDL